MIRGIKGRIIAQACKTNGISLTEFRRREPTLKDAQNKSGLWVQVGGRFTVVIAEIALQLGI